MVIYFSDAKLVKAPPVKRAAYSDRTAWIMAEISRLVYEPLPGEVSIKTLVEEIKAAIGRGEVKDAVEALVKKAIEGGVSPDSPIEEELRGAGFELLEPFAVDGTEAFLARLKKHKGFDGMLVLAFRGTQPSIRDVLTDIKADLVSAPGGGRVHRGFIEAFEKVRKPIASAVKKHASLPVYITGHSLGGALALIATRELGADSTGACYTFGGPRVADDTFFEQIKTPVYRVINAADGVPRVPFGYGLSVFLALIRLVPINGTLQISEWIRRNFLGYTHYGNSVFLSAVPNEQDENGFGFKRLVVKKSPNIFWRAKIVLPRLIKTWFKAAASDHAMQEYSQKLLAYAQRRNVHSK